jgi:hypothetical protein
MAQSERCWRVPSATAVKWFEWSAMRPTCLDGSRYVNYLICNHAKHKFAMVCFIVGSHLAFCPFLDHVGNKRLLRPKKWFRFLFHFVSHVCLPICIFL